MAVYLLLAKYSPEGAKGVQKDGLVLRRQIAEKTVAAIGGKVLGYYACADAEWDVVNLFEAPDENAALLSKTTTALTATGAFSRLRILPLATPEAYDATDVQAQTQAYKAPGQG